MTGGKSFAVIESGVLRGICERAIERVDAEREEAQLAAIDAEIAKSERSWIRKLFGWKVPTREEVRRSFAGGDFHTALWWSSKTHIGHAARDLAENLLATTEVVARVHVAADEFALIRSWAGGDVDVEPGPLAPPIVCDR